MSQITRNAKEYRSMTAQLMSQNLPIVSCSFGIFCVLRHSNHFVLAGANNRNVIILPIPRGPCSSILGDPGAVSRAGRKGAKKVFKHRRKIPRVPTLTEPSLKGQANAGSWLGTKNAFYYCAQSANNISWVLFVSSYTTAIDLITACLAHARKKCTQSGIFQFDINATFQNTGSLYTRA